MIGKIDAEVLPAIDRIIRNSEVAISELSGYQVTLKVSVSEECVQATDLRVRLIVCSAFKVDWVNMVSKSKKAQIAMARQAYCYMMRMNSRFSLQRIGGILGGRHHTTVIASCEAVQDMIDTENPDFVPVLHQIIEQFNADALDPMIIPVPKKRKHESQETLHNQA